jgi:hypothetical protein
MWGSLMNASIELIFPDFVPFNIQQGLEKPFLGFFFNFLRNLASKSLDWPKF